MKKVLAWGLFLVMTIQLLPLSVWAVETEETTESQVVSTASLTETEDSSDDTISDDTGMVMDDATMANLNSILQQLETTGLTFYSSGLSTSEKVLDLSSWDSSYLSATVTGQTSYLDIGTVTVPAGESSSFRWDIIGENPSSSMSLGATGVQYVNSGETLSLTNDTDADIEYTITLGYLISSGMNDFEGYTGTILNAIQFSNPDNLMFYQQGAFRDNGTVFLGYDKSYAFYGYGDGWSTSYTGYGSNVNSITTVPNTWELVSATEQTEAAYKLFENTANAVFGSGTHSYTAKADWTLSGVDTTDLGSTGVIWMENATAWPYDETTSSAMGVASYIHTTSYTTFIEGVTNTHTSTYNVGTTYPYYDLDATNTYVKFYLNASLGDFTNYNTLEMITQGNSIPTDFILNGEVNIWYYNTSNIQTAGTLSSPVYQMYMDNRSIAIYDVTK